MHATLIPNSSASAHSESLTEHRACFVAEYMDVIGKPYVRPAVDDTFTTVPWPRIRIAESTARTHRMGPNRLVVTTAIHSSSLSSSIAPDVPPMPALLTST